MVFSLGSSVHVTSSRSVVGSRRRRRIDVKSCDRGAVPWRRPAAAPVIRQLFWRVRSKLRNAVMPRARRGAARSFGYDLQSYSRNFDDGGLVVSGHRF